MPGKEKLTAKCEKCGRVLPMINDDGTHNFHMVGGLGNRKQVCVDCKQALEKASSGRVGFGQ